MIVTRLVLHSRNVRKAMGTSNDTGGLHKAIATMLVESAGLYAVAFLLFIGTWGANSPAQFIFLPVIAEVQVRHLSPTLHDQSARSSNHGGEQAIAPFLIILRVADRRALTSETIVSGNLGSIHFRSQGKSTVDDGTLPDDHHVSSTDADGEISQELGAGAESAIEEVSL